jgi:hypothetical protein
VSYISLDCIARTELGTGKYGTASARGRNARLTGHDGSPRRQFHGGIGCAVRPKTELRSSGVNLSRRVSLVIASLRVTLPFAPMTAHLKKKHTLAWRNSVRG